MNTLTYQFITEEDPKSILDVSFGDILLYHGELFMKLFIPTNIVNGVNLKTGETIKIRNNEPVYKVHMNLVKKEEKEWYLWGIE